MNIKHMFTAVFLSWSFLCHLSATKPVFEPVFEDERGICGHKVSVVQFASISALDAEKDRCGGVCLRMEFTDCGVHALNNLMHFMDDNLSLHDEASWADMRRFYALSKAVNGSAKFKGHTSWQYVVKLVQALAKQEKSAHQLSHVIVLGNGVDMFLHNSFCVDSSVSQEFPESLDAKKNCGPVIKLPKTQTEGKQEALFSPLGVNPEIQDFFLPITTIESEGSENEEDFTQDLNYRFNQQKLEQLFEEKGKLLLQGEPLYFLVSSQLHWLPFKISYNGEKVIVWTADSSGANVTTINILDRILCLMLTK